MKLKAYNYTNYFLLLSSMKLEVGHTFVFCVGSLMASLVNYWYTLILIWNHLYSAFYLGYGLNPDIFNHASGGSMEKS